MRSIPILLVVGIGSLLTGAVAPACSDNPRYRAFDFWIGHWDVRSASNEYLGSNQITSEQGGCVLVERWSGSQGGTGMSINYFDPQTSSWRQHWVAAAGYLVDLTGGLTDGSMIMEGSLVTPEGDAQPIRGTWTPLEDGRVRQTFEVADSTDAWSTWFDGFYERMDDE